MGKARILDNLGAGKYRVALEYDRQRAEAEAARLAADQLAIAERLISLEDEINSALLALDGASAVWSAALDALATTPTTQRAQAEDAVKAAQTALQAAQRERLRLGELKNFLTLRQLANHKRLEFLAEQVPADPEQEIWCADLSEELTGAVGTVELGRSGGPVVIRPGDEAAAFDAARDGQLQPIYAGTAASAFVNYALLPGLDRWRPRYRSGVVADLSGDWCSVLLDPAPSSHQRLETNPAAILTKVPIEYMDCNGAAFVDGDHVIVEFPDRDPAQPVVVGFVREPQPCGPGACLLYGAGAVWVYRWRSDALVAGGAGLGEFTSLQQWAPQGRAGLYSASRGDYELNSAGQPAQALNIPPLSLPLHRSGLTLLADGGFRVRGASVDQQLAGAIPQRTLTGLTLFGSLPVAVTHDQAPAWNGTSGPEAWSVPFGTGPNPVHRWAPRIFMPDIGNLFPEEPQSGRFYYGKYSFLLDGGIRQGYILPPLLPDVANNDPKGAAAITVVFGGYFENRFNDQKGAPIFQGYSETVTSITPYGSSTPQEFLTAYFIGSLWEPGRATQYRAANPPVFIGNTVGSSLQGGIPLEEFAIDYSGLLGTAAQRRHNPKIHWWSSIGPNYATASANSYSSVLGVFAEDGERWALHRVTRTPDPGADLGFSLGPTVALAFAMAGDGYMGHSLSTNGEIVAVFMGAGVMERCLVYDLANNVLLRDRPLEAGLALTSGSVLSSLPYTRATLPTLPATPHPVTATTTPERWSALGGFQKIPSDRYLATTYAEGWKIRTAGGVATTERWVDNCWAEAKVTLLKPLSHEWNYLYGTEFAAVVEGVEYRATGWGNFVALLPYLVWSVFDPNHVHNQAGLADMSGAYPQCLSASALQGCTVECYGRANDLIVGTYTTPGNFRTTGVTVTSSNAVGPLSWSLSQTGGPAIFSFPSGAENPLFLYDPYEGEFMSYSQFICTPVTVRAEVTDACGATGFWEKTILPNWSPIYQPHDPCA